MSKITEAQVKTLKKMADCKNPLEAREMRAKAEIYPSTWTDDSSIARLMIRASYATYLATDKGREGKAGEAETRLSCMESWKYFRWTWGDCAKRPDTKTDCIRYYTDANGVKHAIHLESKTGSGDWCKVTSSSLSEGLEEETKKAEKQPSSFIWWHTPDFELLFSKAEFYQLLETYSPRKGLLTWFNSQLKAAESVGLFVIRSQPYSTSRKKTDFLISLERLSYSFDELAQHGRLVRNYELVKEGL